MTIVHNKLIHPINKFIKNFEIELPLKTDLNTEMDYLEIMLSDQIQRKQGNLKNTNAINRCLLGSDVDNVGPRKNEKTRCSVSKLSKFVST